VIPAGMGWQSLKNREGEELESHYRHVFVII
jgi:hypothetical protein